MAKKELTWEQIGKAIGKKMEKGWKMENKRDSKTVICIGDKQWNSG